MFHVEESTFTYHASDEELEKLERLEQQVARMKWLLDGMAEQLKYIARRLDECKK